MRYFIPLLSVVFVFAPSFGLAADNWPQFRGPDSRGLGKEDRRLPEVWSATQNVVWKTAVPGRGWSSPVVWGDKVFLTSVIKEGSLEEVKKGLYFGGERGTPEKVHRWKVYCLSFDTGEVLWEQTAHKGSPESSHHLKNTFASETPVTDGERIYAYFGNTGLFAYDMDGGEQWTRRWDAVKTRAGWGSAALPVLHNDRLYVVNDNEDQSFLEALEANTGERIWHVDRDEGSNWSTPFVWENEKRTEIVTPGTDLVRSYNLDGDLLWTLKGMSKITVGTPFSEFGLLFISSGFILDKSKPVYAIRPGASRDISLKEGERQNGWIAWCQPDAAPYIPSPLIYGEYYYVLLDRGFLSCYEARTGKEVYERKRIDRGVQFSSSPWAYNGKVFCISEEGNAYVVEAGPEFKVVGTNSLDELCMASPAIVRGSLLIRTETHLCRIQDRDKEE
jgi:outer membrane protein assembly factor BamB